MSYTKTLAVILSGLAIAGTASAANDFTFDYNYDANAVQTEQGAAQVLEELESQVADHCEDRRIFPRSIRGIMADQCVADTLERTVSQIDTPALDQAFEDWKSSN